MSKILVVDDEFRIREIIKKYAVFEGHEVSEAVDGMSAIEICNRESFDIIIMDVMMPELDGFSACREIRKTCNTPIIMLSARGEEYDKIHGFELGIDDYVVKPFSPKELMMRISAVLKRSKNISVENKDIFKYKDLVVDFRCFKVNPEIHVSAYSIDFTSFSTNLFDFLKLLLRSGVENRQLEKYAIESQRNEADNQSNPCKNVS